MRAASCRRNPTRPKTKPLPWFERDGGALLNRYQAILGESYPGLSLSVDEAGQRASINGVITLRSDCGVAKDVVVRIEFPPDHPRKEPLVYDAANQFPHVADRHFHPDGRCCLWLDCESVWNGADSDAFARFLDQVAVFFDRQFVVDAMPADSAVSWPGPERGHGPLGYVEVMKEILKVGDVGLMSLIPCLAGRGVGRNDPCPCGTGSKYKRCHFQSVSEARRVIGLDRIRQVFGVLRARQENSKPDPGNHDD